MLVESNPELKKDGRESREPGEMDREALTKKRNVAVGEQKRDPQITHTRTKTKKNTSKHFILLGFVKVLHEKREKLTQGQ